MKIALVHNHYDAEHLAQVKSEMADLGAPKIKAVWFECYDMWAAIEGTHRILAAKELGLTPEIIEIENDKDKKVAELGVDIELYDGDETLSWLVDDCLHRDIIEFCD